MGDDHSDGDEGAIEMTDVFGQMCRAYFDDDLVETPTYERDDGETSEAHLAHYFSEYPQWSRLDRVAVDAVADVDPGTDAPSSQVLDLGCGVGRTTRQLQAAGCAPLGVDVSPGALCVARERGVERVATMDLFTPATTGLFDAALVVGQQWCAAGSRRAFRELLCDLAEVVRPGGLLVGDVADPAEAPPEHESYMAARRVEPGVVTRRFRLVYDGETGPWTTLLMLSVERFREVVADTPWAITEVHRDNGRYVVTLRRLT